MVPQVDSALITTCNHLNGSSMICTFLVRSMRIQHPGSYACCNSSIRIYVHLSGSSTLVAWDAPKPKKAIIKDIGWIQKWLLIHLPQKISRSEYTWCQKATIHHHLLYIITCARQDRNQAFLDILFYVYLYQDNTTNSIWFKDCIWMICFFCPTD